MREDGPDRGESNPEAPTDESTPGAPFSIPRGADREVRVRSAATDAPGRPGRAADAGGADPAAERTDANGERAAVADEGGGKVSLVGSGPGHPDLLTRRAWQRLEAADVVCHDSLTGDAIVDRIPDGVEVVDVGKRPPDRTSQAEINDLLRERAARGERVVRLKGGDPNVFGRGGEEASFLADAGVEFEIVPGVSSVLAASGVSGIPLTHREHASSLTVITGHETPEKDESALDWDAIAETVAAGGTLVILMGVRRLPDNVRALRSRDVPADTPAAMVQKATWDDERTVVASLETIVERSRDASVEPPAVTIVGDVVGVRDDVEAHLLS